MKTKWRFKRYFSLIVIGIILSLSTTLVAEVTYPRQTAYKYINDYAQVVDTNHAKQIIALGKELEDETGAQASVVTISSLKGVPIEDYANGLFRKWGIGQAAEDNGLLILLAVEEKQWRVEVGRGLEGAIPDVLSNRIMLELGKEAFSQGAYGQGLAQVYSQFSDQIAEEYGVTLTHSLHTSLPISETSGSRTGHPVAFLWIIVFLLIDLFLNRGRFIRILLWSSLWGGGNRNDRGGGGYGGFGGGSSNGGGSSGSW